MIFEQKTVNWLYKKLLSLYPTEFSEQFRDSMEQTFNDVWIEREKQKELTINFLIWMFAETSAGIVKENWTEFKRGKTMENIISNNKRAAFVAFLFILPFVTLNAVAVNKIEPLYTFFKVNTAGNFWDYSVGHLSLVTALLLLPIGAFIAIRPIFQTGTDKKEMFNFVNGILSVLMVGVFVLVSYAFLEEIYRCNVLLVPNCD